MSKQEEKCGTLLHTQRKNKMKSLKHKKHLMINLAQTNSQFQDYYKFLTLSFPSDVPLINEKQIDLDINRTSTPYKDKLKRILLAYSKRNSSIGYIQGFNFIADKILRFVDDEEKAFWIFVMMIEDILKLLL